MYLYMCPWQESVVGTGSCFKYFLPVLLNSLKLSRLSQRTMTVSN